MMAARDEELALRRALRLSQARDLCKAWGYWCFYGQWGEQAGQRPRAAHGGMDRRYKAPPQWYPAEPKFPEADENAGLKVQRGFVHLPQLYRNILRAEFCVRPWVIGTTQGEIEYLIARKARVSVGAYDKTLDRALLALANILKFKGLWRGA